MKKILTFLSVVTATIMMFSCTNPAETKSKAYNQDMTLEEANEELKQFLEESNLINVDKL